MVEHLIRPSQRGDAVPESSQRTIARFLSCHDVLHKIHRLIHNRSAALNFALRDRGFRWTSSSPAVTGFLVSTE